MIVHLVLVAAANYAAFWLRFDGQVPAAQAPLFSETVMLLVFIRAATFIPFRLYGGLWRYTSLPDVRDIIAAVTVSTGVFVVVVRYGLGLIQYSRSIFIVDSILLVCFMTGIRLTRRAYRDFLRPEGDRRVLIYGAGDAGATLVRHMMDSGQHEYEPIGFIDDDRSKVGHRINGTPVLGTGEDLARVLTRRHADEIMIAMPDADPVTLRTIVKSLDSAKVKITILPKLHSFLNGSINVSQVRPLNVGDLLSRAPVGLDPEVIKQFICDRRILVTGAGGSIGSELCRQIAGAGPAELVMVDRYENGLFAVQNDIIDRNGTVCARPVIGDVTDAARLEAIMRRYRPQVVFHAAAHKHVPLMEQSPCEAVKNNVTGTRVVAIAAECHGVERFVLISTDKAVNPTSVMGATKRVAEFIVQSFGPSSSTSFSVVRFGNVLGSNGSVVPRFVDQIKAGGPVTVTHPEMKRFFMLIPEAVQLVLHTAAAGERGETYVLEMGEQVKVVDMARDLIRLSGFVPDEDVRVVFTGLRPGEKLYEELVGSDEFVVESEIQGTMKVRQRHPPSADRVWEKVGVLERLAAGDRADDTLKALRDLLAMAEMAEGGVLVAQTAPEIT